MNVTTRLLHLITTVDRSTEGRLHDAIDGVPGRHTLVVGPGSALKPLARIVDKVEVIEMPRLVPGASVRDEALIAANLVKLARRRDYAIIHAHSPQTTRIARVVARAAKIPQVCVSTDLDRPYEVERIDRLLDRVAEPPDAIFVESLAARDRMVAQGIDLARIKVVRTSAPISDAVPTSADELETLRAGLGIPPDSKVVAFLGKTDAAHGADIVMSAVATAADGAPVTVLIVGDGPLRSDMLAAATGDVRAQVVTETGRALDVIRASDVLLAPFRGPRAETAQIQAAAAGIPIVGYQQEGVAELFERGAAGHLVPPGDVAALTDALRATLESSDTRAVPDGAGEGNRSWNVWNKAVVAINYRWRYEPDALRPV